MLPDDESKERVTLLIKGMTCSHCAQSVRNALLESPGVGAVEVDQASGKAIVGGLHLDIGLMQRAVEELGYKVIGKESPNTTEDD